MTGRALTWQEILWRVPVEGHIVNGVVRRGNERASRQQEASKPGVTGGAHLCLAYAYGRVHPQGLLHAAFQHECLARPFFVGKIAALVMPLGVVSSRTGIDESTNSRGTQ